MINLLPPDVRESITYARRNTLLRNWILSMVLCLVIIIGIIFTGFVFVQSSIKSHEQQVKNGNQQLEDQNLEETQAQLKELSNNLKLVVQVLSKQILFSKLLTQIGATLPNGSVLTELSIGADQSGIDLQTASINNHVATQVQLNLQDPSNKLFDKSDLISINCSGEISKENPYPCVAIFRLRFTSNNPFLFITKANKQ